MAVQKQNPKVLLFASSSFAGMGPYVASIINSFSPEDNISFFLVEREDRYFSRNIKPELKKSGIIFMEKTPSKLDTLLYLILNGHYDCRKEFKRYCKEINPSVIHVLTNIHDIDLCKWLAGRYKLLYTIHDLHPHEANKSFLQEFRQKVGYKRVYKSIGLCGNIHTNSKSQYDELKKIYPDKHPFYSPFPTLITDEIKDGETIPPELSGISNYLLFFGRVEAYKGVNNLVEAYLSSPVLKQFKLVVAGKGEMNRPSHKNIIYLNRYIDDGEIAALYRNAACVVYPYISITQSGVLSVAMYFGTPIIASEVPFFKEVLKSDYPLFSRTGDIQSIKSTLEKFIAMSKVEKDSIKNALKEAYELEYASASCKQQLLKMYSEINLQLI